MNKEKNRVENYLLGLSDLKNRKDYKGYMKKMTSHSLLNIQVQLVFFLNRNLSFALRNELRYLSDGINFFSLLFI